MEEEPISEMSRKQRLHETFASSGRTFTLACAIIFIIVAIKYPTQPPIPPKIILSFISTT